MTIHNKLFNSKATMSNLINKIMYSWPFMLPKEKIPIFYSKIGMEIKNKKIKKKKKGGRPQLFCFLSKRPPLFVEHTDNHPTKDSKN